MINTVYHNNICEEMLERFNSYRGVVRIETKSGCIVRLENAVDVYVFGSFQIGDIIEVGITKITEGKYKGVCERVIRYARDQAA